MANPGGEMDTFVILSKYTPAGRKYSKPDDARKRWDVIENSLKKTLGGTVIAHYVTLGPYDSVLIFAIRPSQHFQLFQCLVAAQEPGDVELTVMPAWEFNQFAPPAKP
jgi:uncharacterized protein with GYD domain